MPADFLDLLITPVCRGSSSQHKRQSSSAKSAESPTCGRNGSSRGSVRADADDYGIAFRTSRLISTRPRAMNRQVGPSIVLSVLIVCFFAVALFQRDPSRLASRAEPRRSARSAGRTSPGRLPAADGAEPVASLGPESSRTPRSPAAASHRRRDVRRRGQRSSEPGESSAASQPGSRSSATRSPATAPASRSGRRLRTATAERAPRRRRRSRSLAATIGVHRRRGGRDDRGCRPSRLRLRLDEADSLWRANRDALPRRDSPLATGMVLRTPSIR